MIAPRSPKVVILGMITKMPVGGVLWQTLHYLEGFRRLGFDAYYVEAHARTPSSFVSSPGDSGSERAASFLGRLFRRFGLGDRWAFHALHAEGRCYGMGERALLALYESADLIINLHGGTEPRPEHRESGRLVYLGTDPVELEIELYHGRQATVEFLDAHCAHFSFAENYGASDCLLPVSDRFRLVPTRQPVVLDFWPRWEGDREAYTTVANWKQPFRTIRFEGEPYLWSKHAEFLKFVNVPLRAAPRFELALASFEPADQALLEERGWTVRDAVGFTYDLDAYRDYVATSRAEFTVAKDQNVRFRSGWFSDRSATYLAAGRPVITQDTGFGRVLPTGEGLFPFSSMEEILAAVDVIESDYPRARQAARDVARGFFAHDVVLGSLLSELGVRVPAVRRPSLLNGPHGGEERGPSASDPSRPPMAWPEELVLEPVSRRPLRLPGETLRRVLARPLPAGAGNGSAHARRASAPGASVIVVTYDGLALNRLCLESLLAHTPETDLEVIVVDNGSADGTPQYLQELEKLDPRVVPVLRSRNEGFPAACNHGLERASGETLVLLNNDAIVPPAWLEKLRARLGDSEVGGVNPVTNRIGTEAEVEVRYRTYGEWLDAARSRAQRYAGETRDVRMLAMFCLAMTREVHARLGPLDTGFGTGLFEDDDYSARFRAAGMRLVCAEDVLVHHFGQASFGELVPSGEYGRLFRRNRQRYEETWGESWQTHGRRTERAYAEVVTRARRITRDHVPEDSTVVVMSRGDEDLVELDGRIGWHFPRLADGTYAGHYPEDGRAAVAQLEVLREEGAEYLLVPEPAFWWLEHYWELDRYLRARSEEIVRDGQVRLFRLGSAPPRGGQT